MVQFKIDYESFACHKYIETLYMYMHIKCVYSVYSSTNP